MSFRSLPRAKIQDIPKLCDYYEEQLKQCFIDDRENAQLVQGYIKQIRSQSSELSNKDTGFNENMNKVNKM